MHLNIWLCFVFLKGRYGNWNLRNYKCFEKNWKTFTFCVWLDSKWPIIYDTIIRIERIFSRICISLAKKWFYLHDSSHCHQSICNIIRKSWTKKRLWFHDWSHELCGLHNYLCQSLTIELPTFCHQNLLEKYQFFSSCFRWNEKWLWIYELIDGTRRYGIKIYL